MSDLNVRSVSVFDGGDMWFNINAIDVRQGDVIKMFEPDGTPVVSDDGETIFICQSDARYNEDGVIVIEYEYNGI